LEMCPQRGNPAPPEPFLSDPDRVLARLDSFVSRYGAQSMLYDAWVSNPSLFKLLLIAFDRSEFLAELAIRVPDLIDEIEQSGQLRRKRTAEQVLQDLRHGAKEENQHRWLRRYYQAEEMRIGLRDILDLADPEQTQIELSELADAYLTYALEVVMKKHRLKKPPFAIFGLGKLGGRELIYGSDLDIIFVAENKTENMPALQKIAGQVMELLSKRTEDGTTFETDARLRPDGEKGLLVNSSEAYLDYYQRRALLWEIQSLSRFRPICGNASVLKSFATMVERVVDFSNKKNTVAAFTTDWKSEIHKMRMRIEKERTPAGQDRLAIKTGRGGLMDVEFVAQALCLENGWHEPNTLAAIARAAEEEKLSEKAGKALTENYRKLMQVERILRRWSFEAESVLPTEPEPYYRVAVRCGYKTPDAFEKAVLACREVIRAEYLKVFESREKA
ncbi:MAG: [protein-PII] uridylyltransferase family protein, partial [Limisphaerales bacterium]